VDNESYESNVIRQFYRTSGTTRERKIHRTLTLAVAFLLVTWVWRIRAEHADAAQHVLKNVAYSIGFTPDSKKLIAGGKRGISVWNTSNWKLENTLRGHTSAISLLVSSRDSRLLATWSNPWKSLESKGFSDEDFIINIWDLKSGKLSQQLHGIKNEAIPSATFSPDNASLAAACDRTVRIWDVSTARLRKTLPKQKEDITALTYSPDGRILITACMREVKFWDVRSGTLLRELSGVRGLVETFAFRGGELISIGNNGVLQKWEFPSGKMLQTLDLGDGTSDVDVTPDGNYIASTVSHGGPTWHKPYTDIRVQDTQKGNVVWSTRVNDEYLPVAISPDRKWLAVSRLSNLSDNSYISIWGIP